MIGLGVVGRAQAKMFGDVVTYDITQPGPYPRQEIAGCDFAVITVGTPQSDSGHANLNAVWQAIHELPAGLPVLLRSTVPPGTTDHLARAYPDRLIAHAPEYLTERDGGAWPESGDVPYMILGGTVQARRFFRAHLADRFLGYIHECTAVVAELAKYTANLYWATRVTFVNEISKVCETAGADWEDVRQAWVEDPRVNSAYTSMEGFPPGFGGACWPKDLAALIAYSTGVGYEPGFLRAISEANERFRGELAKTTGLLLPCSCGPGADNKPPG